MSVVRLGLTGCGSYGRHLASKVQMVSGARLEACFDPFSENALRLANAEGCAVAPTLDELFSAVDAVLVVTPNRLHRETALAAFGAGRPVFVEKPLADSVEDCEKIIKAAEVAGLPLAVGHNGRRKPGHRAMKLMIDEGRIGRVITAEANFSRPGAREITSQSWRLSECPSLPLTQLGIHHIDTLHYLLGQVAEVAALMTRLVIVGENVDNTATLLQFDSGALGSLISSYVSAPAYHILLVGESGSLFCRNGKELILRTGSEETTVSVACHDDIAEEIEDFVRSVRGEGSPEVGGREALEAVRVLEAAQTSAQLGVRIVIAR